MPLPRFRKYLLQTPPAEWALSKIKDLLIGALRQGPVPKHVAFVMDGNRRFARKNQIESIEGHNLGFEALARILEVCYKAGVEVVTIYAFSIENFKRPKYEVDALMEMAKTKLAQLSQHGELLDRYGASIRILGQMDLVNKEVLRAVDDAVNLTKDNKKAILNVCFPYTSRDEITTSLRTAVAEYSQPLPISSSKRAISESAINNNVRFRQLSTLQEESASSRSPTPETDRVVAASTATQNSNLSHSTSASSFSSSTTLNHDSTFNSSPNTSYQHSPEAPSSPVQNTHNSDTSDSHNATKPIEKTAVDPIFPDPETITSATLNSHMFTAGMPPLDLLVRTSGVERLSDFMLWQCHEQTSIVFLDCLWPEFDLWRFLPVLVEWQWWRRKMGSNTSARVEGAR